MNRTINSEYDDDIAGEAQKVLEDLVRYPALRNVSWEQDHNFLARTLQRIRDASAFQKGIRAGSPGADIDEELP